MNVFNINHAQVRLQTGDKWEETSKNAPRNATGGYQPLIHELEEKLVEGDTYFIQSENGKIYKVVYPKNEDPIITNMKKSIIQELQTKVKGDSRVEQSTEGIIKGHYTRAQGDDGTVYLQKKSDSADILQDAFGDEENNNHLSGKKFEQESIVALTSDGRVKEAVSTKNIEFGKGSEGKQRSFRNLRDKIQFQKGQEAPSIDGYFSGNTKSVLSFVEQIDISQEIKDVNLVDINPEELFAEGNVELLEDDDYSEDDLIKIKTKVHESLKESTLIADEDLRVSLRDLYKKKLIDSVDLRGDLNKLHNFHKELARKHKETGEEDLQAEYTNENLSLVAQAQHYCRYLPKQCLEVAQKYFSEIDADADENHSISHILQSMMVSSQSEKGQEALLESMKNSHLIRHAILRTLELKKPINAVISKLKDLSQGKGIPENTNEDEKTFIKDNAYMAYADVASRIDPNNAIGIVEEIIGNLKNVEEEDDLVYHIHALGNAGEAVPIEAIRHLITSNKIGDPAKEAAIDALRKFKNPETNKQITKILHNVLQDPREHQILKKRAVSVIRHRLENRPRKLFKSSFENDEDEDTSTISVKFLERFLHDKNVDPTLKKAILEFYLEEGSDISADIVENYFTGIEGPIFYDEEFDEKLANYFNDDDEILGVVRRIGRAIGEAVRRVGRVVKNVIDGAKAIAQLPGKIANAVTSFKNVFKTATFKGNKICRVVGADGSRLCVYDTDMAAFIQRQGDLSKMKWNKNFSFEKLLGTEALHAYVGGVGYAGASINCKQGQVAVSVFGRVSAYTRILNKRTELLTGELELNKLVNQNVNDRVYLKVFGSVIVNKSLLPEKVKKFINECSTSRINLINKDYPNLVSIEIIIPIVIPFSIRLGVAAKFGIDFSYSVCPSQLKVNAGIEPYFGLGITGGAGISIFVAKGHVTLTARLDYRLRPNVGIENCQLCARLDHETNPLVLAIGGSLSFLTFSWNKNFFEWKSPSIKGTFFKSCLNLQNLVKDDDDYEMTPNLKYLNSLFSNGKVEELIYTI